VTKLTHRINCQRVTVDQHLTAVEATQHTLDSVLDTWGTEISRLEQLKAAVAEQQIVVDRAADRIEGVHYALEDADKACSKEEVLFSFLRGNLAHHTDLLRDLGLRPTE